jgi:hypothetical protein
MMSDSIGNELHLDADEWSNILHALKAERDRAEEGQEFRYAKYIGGIVLKLEIAGIEDA